MEKQQQNNDDLVYRVYEEIDAALTDDELNKEIRPVERRVKGGDWKEAFTRGFIESLRNLQSRLNNLKYQAKVPPEFLFQIDFIVPKFPHLHFICTLEYHKAYQFEEGLRKQEKLNGEPLITPVNLGDVYSKLLQDYPLDLSSFDVYVEACAKSGILLTAQFDSVQHRAIYELNTYGGLVVTTYSILNRDKYKEEISPDLPKILFWAVFDAAQMGLTIGEDGKIIV